VNTSCSQLTEDDKVFIALSPVFPDCYQQDHDTLVIAGSLPGTLPASAAPDFSLSPPDANFDPLMLAAFNKRGTFKGKKVAIFYGADSDKPEVTEVQKDLKKLHINVALTAEDSVQATDAVASDQEVQTIAQRFQSSGVNVVIGVGGSGSTTWPRALFDNQSTYKPQYIATSESSLLSYVNSAKGANPYLDNVLAALPIPSNYQEWKDPAIQKCASIVKKAYPSDTIHAPVNPSSAAAASADSTAVSVIQACQDLAIFAKIADAAGKKLTVASFTKAGYALRNASFPGSGGPVSFGPNQPYAIGPVNIVTYSQTSKTLVPAPTK
jgi:Periplasmic binding protein